MAKVVPNQVATNEAGKRDFTSFFEECQRAPRINELASWFEATANGESGFPIKQPQIDRRLLKHDDEVLDQFIQLFERRLGPFMHHYHASIPYRMEEHCRQGRAILQYSQLFSRPLLYRVVGCSDSSMARTVAEFADGQVEVLTCSPNAADKRNFASYGPPAHAIYFHGPFHHLTDEVVNSRQDLAKFAAGFDIIHEETTFQMYSPNRAEQVAFVAQSLREDGVFIVVEKFRHPNIEEYERRELQKDYGFKARFFSQDEVAAKGRDVLTTMSLNQVTLDEMTSVYKEHFRHCYVTWNSGNFYTVVASNSLANLDHFVAELGEPAIPKEYMYEDVLPRLLF